MDIEEFQLRQKARDSLPWWLKVIMPTTFLFFTFCGAFLVCFFASILYAHSHPNFSSLFLDKDLNVACLIVLFCSFIVGLSVSLFLSNYVLRRIAPIRNILDAAAQGVPGAGYENAIRFAGKFFIYGAVPALFVLIVAVLV